MPEFVSEMQMIAECLYLWWQSSVRMNAMISAEEALKKAKKYKVPTADSGEFIQLPSLEVLHFFLQINGLEIAGWRGDYLQVRTAKEKTTNKTGVDL